MGRLRLVCGVVVVAGLFALGCNNRPNALRLEVEPVQDSFKVGEPVRLAATFASTNGTVSITRPRFDAFCVELKSADVVGKEGMVRTSNDQRVIIRFLEQVFFPINFVWLYLDVADLGGRFALVSPNKGTSCFLALFGMDGRLQVYGDDGKNPGRWSHSRNTLPPGRYRVDLMFRSTDSAYNPPPLFWRVYDSPVSASAEFTILPDDGSDRGDDSQVATPTG